MISGSPGDVLGPRAADAQKALVDIVRRVHDRFAESHLVSGSRFSMGFGTQWRDLLAEAHEEFAKHGFESHKLVPAGYRLPIVNGCLLYVWRKPDSADADAFAGSLTKKNSFNVRPPDPALLEPDFGGAFTTEAAEPEEPKLEGVVRAARDVMPLIVIIVHSSPWQLQSIEWAVAELDEESGAVKYHGQEAIWVPEAAAADAAVGGESFDSGIPAAPAVQPRKQEGIDPDA